MAQESELPTSADKGKGKAVENPKDEKAVANGKKDEKDSKDGGLRS
jgi:26S proteasome regulatory subunit N1